MQHILAPNEGLKVKAGTGVIEVNGRSDRSDTRTD